MLTVDDVRAALGIDPADTADDQWLAHVVDAVNVYVARLPVVVDSPDPATWTADVTWGATGLAVHRYHTRGAPYGRATFDTAGFAQAYPDAEIMRALQLRRHAKPGIAG